MTLPPTLEVCPRDRWGHPCGGVIFRPLPDLPRCVRCGAAGAGTLYDRRPDPLPPARQE